MDAPVSSPSPTIPGSLDTLPPPITEDSEQFDEAQLREIYETEEIERFLRLFSTYVNEVKASEAPNVSLDTSIPLGFSEREGEWALSEGDASDRTEERPPEYECISQEVAYRFLLPLLPSPRTSPQDFTLNRFRLASERVYLAVVPNYFPFLLSAYRLAKWQDKEKSLFICACFWILWSQDLLLAALFFGLILILLKHRFFAHPSRSELKRRRQEIYDADRFSEQLSQRLSAPSVFGVRDIWRFGRLFVLPPKEKKPAMKVKAHLSREEAGEPTVLEDTNDSEEVQEMKRLGLFVMNEIADLHERIKNVFIWRDPASSWLYLCLLSLLFLGTLLVPTRYVLRAIFGTLGFAFWHVVPIVLALSPEDSLPPPMANVPTDAEYAMELISQRVAAGLEIKPSRLAKGKAPSELPPQYTPSPPGSTMLEEQFDDKSNRIKVMTSRVRGMGRALDSGKSLLQGGKQFISRMQTTPSEDDAPSFKNLVNPSPTTYTYPAQHSSAPGLITLTPTTFYFSPVTSTNRRLTISLQDIKGVKKAGVLKGMEIVWAGTGLDGRNIDKLEKFRWINNRDELFARVISANSGMKWMKVQ